MTHRTARFRGTCVALCALLVVLSGCSSDVSRPAADTSSVVPARTLDPATVTVAIEDYIRHGSAGLRNIRAVLISVDGVTQVAHYRDGLPTDRAHVFSVTKSVLSTLVGIAVSEGILKGLDQDLRTLLPEYREEMSAADASITLEQLLTMTSGIPEGTLDEDPRLDNADYVREILRGGTVEPSGTKWIYSDPAADVLAAVLTAALRRQDGRQPRTLLEYARQKLFDPLDIQTRPAYTGFEGNEPLSAKFNDVGFGWATDHRGRHYGCCMLKLTAEDMVKIGQLYLEDGRWKGRQIVPADWVAAATTPIQLESAYGRMWWIRDIGAHHAFFAQGRAGQLVAVVPDLRVVVAISTHLDTKNETNKYMQGEDLLPMINDLVLSRLE
jgi:CubicO group peptidase (beta-lactamase class C family)